MSSSRSQKIGLHSLTLMCNILELVKQGKIAADIATTLNMSKQKVSYHIKHAKDLDYVKQVTRSSCVILELTQAGHNFLDKYTQSQNFLDWDTPPNQNHQKPHGENQNTRILRLENMQFKAKVLQMPTTTIPVDWKKIEMNNWVQYNSQVDNITVKLNLGDPPSLILIPSPIDGDNPIDLLFTLGYECINALLELYNKTGLRVDKLQPCSRPEWVTYDPIAKSFCKNNGQVTYEGGKVNASPPNHIGEVEFYDPLALVDYLSMPKRLQNIEAILEKFLCPSYLYLPSDSSSSSSSIDNNQHNNNRCRNDNDNDNEMNGIQ